jgi:hypothetical protein
MRQTAGQSDAVSVTKNIASLKQRRAPRQAGCAGFSRLPVAGQLAGKSTIGAHSPVYLWDRKCPDALILQDRSRICMDLSAG